MILSKKEAICTCLDCGIPVTRQAVYCKSCGYKNMRHRPPGYKLKLKVVNKGWFKEGQSPWNKGIKTGIVTAGCAEKGEHRSSKTEFRKGDNKGEKNHKWKGDKVGYYGLHTWVQRELGKAEVCSVCGNTNNVDWSNISGKYLRDIKDNRSLCRTCHLRYDWDNIPRSIKQNFNSKGGRVCV